MWAKGRGQGPVWRSPSVPVQGHSGRWEGATGAAHSLTGEGGTCPPIQLGGQQWFVLSTSARLCSWSCRPPTAAAGGAPVLPLMEQEPFSELCPRGQFDPARPRPNCFPLSFTKGHVVIFLTTLLWKEEKFQQVYLENWSVNKVSFHLQRRTVNFTGVAQELGIFWLLGFFKITLQL